MSSKSKPEPITVRLIIRPTPDPSPSWEQLWRWLLAPVQDGATTEGSPRPAAGDAHSHGVLEPAQEEQVTIQIKADSGE
jgi:hypothetical protein